MQWRGGGAFDHKVFSASLKNGSLKVLPCQFLSHGDKVEKIKSVYFICVTE